MSDSLQPHGVLLARSPCPSPANSWSLLKLMSIESVMASNHLILCRPLLPLSIFPSLRVSSNGSVLHIRWPKCWSFSFNISPSNEYQDWFPLGWTGWISSQSKGLTRVFSNVLPMVVYICQWYPLNWSPSSSPAVSTSDLYICANIVLTDMYGI